MVRSVSSYSGPSYEIYRQTKLDWIIINVNATMLAFITEALSPCQCGLVADFICLWKKCKIAEKSVKLISTEDGFQRTDTAQILENPAFVPGLMSNFSEDPQKASSLTKLRLNEERKVQIKKDIKSAKT